MTSRKNTSSTKNYGRKTILLLCTEGASYRNFINTKIVDELNKKANILIVCADWMRPFLEKKFKKEQLISIYVPKKTELVIDHIRKTRTIYPPAMYPDVPAQSLKIKRDRDLKIMPIRFYARRCIAIVMKSKTLQNTLQKIAWLWRKEQVTKIFEKNNIDSVVSSNILVLDHLPYLEYAIKNKITTIAFVGSWDNMTSKGTPLYLPNKILVWGPKQVEECVKLHKLPKNVIKTVGAPQFDPYFNDEVPAVHELYDRLHLPNDAHIMTYVGGIPQNIVGLSKENESIIIKTMLQGIDEKKFADNMYLVVRPHPGVKDWKQYEQYEKHPRVRINYPSWYLEKKDPPKSWNPNWDDHLFMGGLMKYSDVVVTPGGSSTLDASCFGTPSVNIYFDDRPRPYLESLKSHCDFDHLRYIREFGASVFAQSPEELLTELTACIRNRNLHRDGQNKMLRSIIGFTDGKAKDRIVDEILN